MDQAPPFIIRVPASTSNIGPGFDTLGLGLALSREIILTHHGRIWAESPGVNQGATFSFTLPDAETGQRLIAEDVIISGLPDRVREEP